MKVVINKQYGKFRLSAAGMKRIAELQGKSCFFYKYAANLQEYILVSCNDYDNSLGSVMAFDTENLTEIYSGKNLCNAINEHKINDFSDDRENPILVQVVEELGAKASDFFSNLVVEEIPDGATYIIEERDGLESIEPGIRSFF